MSASARVNALVRQVRAAQHEWLLCDFIVWLHERTGDIVHDDYLRLDAASIAYDLAVSRLFRTHRRPAWMAPVPEDDSAEDPDVF